MEFKDKIKKRRIELGLTLEEIAKLVKVSAPTIQRYESGTIKNLRRDKIKSLSDALKVTPAYLMGWEEAENHNNDIDTIAAHHDGEKWTEEELEDIERFKAFVKSKRQ